MMESISEIIVAFVVGYILNNFVMSKKLTDIQQQIKDLSSNLLQLNIQADNIKNSDLERRIVRIEEHIKGE